MRSTPTLRTAAALALAAFFTACPTAAHAQTALGDGTKLDRNLQQGSGGRNYQGRDLRAEIRFRNAIVTGNAPSGLAFRGRVGYRADDEFRGVLGSDSSFGFRRDSLYSGLAGVGLRGTDALQYQFALTTGSSVPAALSGPLTLSRTPAGMPPSSTASVNRSALAVSPAEARVERSGQGVALPPSTVSDLRSTSAFLAARGMTPSMIGIKSATDGTPMGITASPLTGISNVALDAQRRNDLLRAESQGFINTRTPDAQRDTQANPLQVDTQVAAPSEYDQLLNRLRTAREAQMTPARPDAASPDATPATTESKLDELRRMLKERQEADERRVMPESRLPSGQTPADTRPPGTTPPEASPTLPPGVDDELVRAIRRAGGKIENLTPVAPSGFDAYSEQMRAGQRLLAEGRMFDAEERFTSALGAKPADTMASVGRLHAQIGAGMYVSAAANLRSLLTDHPELAGVRYGKDLLPKAERLDATIDRLRTGVRTTGRGFPRESALLLSYLGFQRDDDAMVREGLDALGAMLEQPDTATPGMKTTSPDARLLKFLRGVWLGESIQPAPPATPPATPQPGE